MNYGLNCKVYVEFVQEHSWNKEEYEVVHAAKKDRDIWDSVNAQTLWSHLNYKLGCSKSHGDKTLSSHANLF
jgi:hypothetical protein